MIFSKNRTVELDQMIKLYQPVIDFTPTLNPRVKLKKTKQLLHKKGTSIYAWLILLEKIIDFHTAKSYSWIEEIDKEEITPILEELKQNKPTPYKRKKKLKYRPPVIKIRNKRIKLTEEEKKIRQKQRQKRNYEKNKEKILLQKKEYYQKNKEAYDRNQEYQKQYRIEHREERRLKSKEYYQVHKEQVKQKMMENYYKKKNQNIPSDQTENPIRETGLDN